MLRPATLLSEVALPLLQLQLHERCKMGVVFPVTAEGYKAIQRADGLVGSNNSAGDGGAAACNSAGLRAGMRVL